MIRVGSPPKTRQHVQLSLRAINSHTSWLVNLPLPDIPPLRNEGLIKPYQGKRMVNARGVGWLAMNTVATAVNLQGPTLLVDAETKVWIWLGEFSTMFSLFLGGALQMFQTWKMAYRLGWKDGSEPRICVQDWKPYFGLVPSSLCFGKEGMIFELLRVRLSKLALNSKRNLHHRNWKANESCFGRLSFQTFFPFAQCISKTYTLSTDPWYPQQIDGLKSDL